MLFISRHSISSILLETLYSNFHQRLVVHYSAIVYKKFTIENRNESSEKKLLLYYCEKQVKY